MWLTVFAYCQQVWSFFESLFRDLKDVVRMYVGPGTSDYILLSNMDVLSDMTVRSFVWDSTALLYTHKDKRVRPYHLTPVHSLPYTRLPWVSIHHKYAHTTTDLTECLTEIRTQSSIPLIQCIRLAAQINNIHLVESHGAFIHVIDRTGEEKVYEYKGCTELVQA